MAIALSDLLVYGDVTIEQTRLNVKGGSMTATLKKALRAAFDEGANEAVGARLDFPDHHSLVLLAPIGIATGESDALGRVQITRVHERRFMVELVDDDSPKLEETTKAFLTILVEQAREGRRKVVDSETARERLEALAATPMPRRPVR